MKKTLLSLMCFSTAMMASAQMHYNSSKSAGFDQPANKAVAPQTVKEEARPAVTRGPLKANYLMPEVVADGETMAFGFSTYDHERWLNTYSFFKFNTEQPDLQHFNKIADFANRKDELWVPVIQAMTFVGEKLYANAYRPFDLGGFYNYGLLEMNLNDGSYKMARRFYRWDGSPENDIVSNTSYEPNCPFLLDMSYDPTTNIIWGTAPDLGGSLYRTNVQGYMLAYVDLSQEAADPMVPANPVVLGDRNGVLEFSCLTTDHGKILAIENEYIFGDDYQTTGNYETVSSLIEITPDIPNNTYTKRTIRTYEADELCVMGQYNASSLEIDRDNRRLYLTYTDDLDKNVYLAELSLKESNYGKVIKKVQQAGDQFAYGSLAIPYQPGIDDNAPTNVTNLTYHAPSEGVATASFTWDLPTGCYYDREKNPEVQGIRVYRNGELAYTLAADAQELVDNDIPFNLYEYVFVPFNAAGEGLKEARTVFVGKDIPGAPLNVKLTASRNTATLTWDAPTIGAHGSYFDKESVTYTVVRNPGNVTVAEGLKETTFTETLTGPTTGYSYNVMSVNPQGQSSYTTSNIVAIGDPETVPVAFDFGKKADYDVWTVLDNNNDGFAWNWGHFYSAWYPEYDCAYYESAFCRNTPSDYFMSPLIATEEGKEYKLRYDVMTHNFISEFDQYGDPIPTTERFAWYMGPEDMMPGDGSMNRFEEGQYSSKEGLIWYDRQGIFTADDEITRLAFAVLSDAEPNNTGYLKLGKVSIREYSSTDVAAWGIRCESLAGAGKPFKVQVAIKNEGNAPAKGIKVNIFDQDNNLVQTAVIDQAIPAEEQVVAEIECTIAKAGNYYLHYNVELDGDTYTADNACESTAQIEITSGLDGEWKIIGTPNEYVSNWCNMTYAYSKSQALYLADELGLKKGDVINGIGFVYMGNPLFEDMTDIEFEVSLGSTNLDELYSYYKYMWDWSFYPKLLSDDYFEHYAFFGLVDANCTEGDGQIIFPFTDPYVYDGRNLLININRTKSSKVTPDLSWHLFQMRSLDTTEDASVDPKGRALTYYGDNEPTAKTNARGYGNNDLPVLYICYQDITGVNHVSTIDGKLRIDSREGEMSLSEECTNIVLTDMLGRTVATSAKGRTINVPAGVNGVCTVTAILPNGQMKSVKVIVK